MTRTRHHERVCALFGEVRAALGDDASAGWLAGLERDALAVRAGWQDRLDAYLRGLVQGGAITAAQEAAWRAQWAQCKSQRAEQLAFVLLWTVLVSLTTVASQSLSLGTGHLVVAGVFLAVIGLSWSVRTTWFRRLEGTPDLGRIHWAASVLGRGGQAGAAAAQ